MKRKFLIVLFALVAAICCAFGFAGCFETETEQPDAQTGNGGNGSNTNSSEQNNTQQGGTNNSHNSSQNTAQKYTVTYDANGGEFADGETFTQEVTANSLLTAPTQPTRARYTFGGWAKDKNGQNMWQFATDKVTENVTLFAVWLEPSASILSVEGASIDGDQILMIVSPETDKVSLANKVICSSDSNWKLYFDSMGQTEIPTRIAANLNGSLSNGNNEFYIVVTSANGSQINTYKLVVHRQHNVTVSYYDNKNALLNSETALTGETFNANYIPTITGYTFNYWQDKNGREYKSGVIFEGMSLYANATAKTYRITLNVNSGDELSTTEKTVTYDKSFSLPKPTKTGYSFLGWGNSNGSTLFTDNSGASLENYTGTNDITLYAKWQANQYKVTLNKDLSEGGSVSGDGNHAYDSQVTITASTYNGYTFVGWYKGTEQVSTELSYKFKMGFNVTYTAKWIKVTLARDLSAGGSVTSLNKAYKAGESVTVTANTYNGYTWVGWYNNETELTTDLSYTFDMPKENVTYTAKWIKCPVTLERSDTAAGTVSGVDKTVLGAQTTITASTNAGYTWVGWYKDDDQLTTELTYTFKLEETPVTYTAKWTYYTVTTNTTIEDAGTYTEQNEVKTTAGTSVTLKATTNNGYTWVGWYNDETELTTDLSYTFDMPKENVTYTAKWIKVTLARDLSAGGSVTSLNKAYKAGESVTVTANTYNGYTWVGWYNNETELTTDLSYTFDMPKENVTYTARWIKCPVTLEISDTAAGGTVSGVDKTVLGAQTTITANTNKGYTFVGWYKGDDQLTTELTYTFKLEETPVTYTAKWKVSDEMANFIFTSTQNTCKITGIKNKDVTSIVVPDYVTEINGGAFSGCSELQEITLPFVGGSKNATTAFESTFLGYIFGTSSYTGGIATKQYYNENSYVTYYIPTSLKSVTITDGNILSAAFSGCTSLESITIPDNVTYIGDSAFYNCISLESITIPNSVTSIGFYAFSGCTAEIKWGEKPTITEIGEIAFSGYNGVSINIPTSVTSIGNSAFYNCTSLTSINIPNSVTSIGEEAFFGCTNIKMATMPALAIKYIPTSSLQAVIITSGDTIGEWAFENCTSLTSIIIPNSVTSIGFYAFSGCTSLESVTFENPNGWKVSNYGDMRNAEEVTLGTPEENATLLRGIYSDYCWHRYDN